MKSRITRWIVILLLAGVSLPAASLLMPEGSILGAKAQAKDGESGSGSGSGSNSGSGSGSGGGGNSGPGGGDDSGGGDNSGPGSGDDAASHGGKGKRDGGSVRRYLDLLKNRDQVARVSRSGSTIEVRYTDGWRETISGNRYRLYDQKNRRVMDRPVRPEDYERLRAAQR